MRVYKTIRRNAWFIFLDRRARSSERKIAEVCLLRNNTWLSSINGTRKWETKWALLFYHLQLVVRQHLESLSVAPISTSVYSYCRQTPQLLNFENTSENSFCAVASSGAKLRRLSINVRLSLRSITKLHHTQIHRRSLQGVNTRDSRSERIDIDAATLRSGILNLVARLIKFVYRSLLIENSSIRLIKIMEMSTDLRRAQRAFLDKRRNAGTYRE